MTTTLEVTPIEGIDLESVPPCGITLWETQLPCGKPAVCRIIRICGCGSRLASFVCARCKERMIRDGLHHYENGIICPITREIRYI